MKTTRLPVAVLPLLLLAAPAFSQQATPLKPEEIEQLVAPIALYPDSLVAQILMASTYPLEVVQAERFASQNKDLKGDALTEKLEAETWDASVKSLVNFPQVLTMMSDELDWTTKLGDAFLANQKDVMDAVQRLRGKAKSEGNLESNQQQTVIVQQEPQTQTEVIVIQSPSPEVVYVPTYNPTVVYGSWPYPAYPPYSYYPPGYVATAAVSFGLGVAAGAAWGHAWGSCNWGHGDIDIDARSFESNRINNSRSASNIGNRNTNLQNGRGKWQHDPSHRKGAAYRDQGTAGKFGGQSAADAARSRDQFRGRAEAGRQDLARGGANQPGGGRGSNMPGQSNRGAAARQQPAGGRQAGAGQQPSARQQPSNRSGSGAQNRPATADRGRSSASQGGGGLSGANQGSRARADSQRGQSSRQASGSPSRSSGRSSGFSGGSRGGGSRGGGARGGGGRGGGRR